MTVDGTVFLNVDSRNPTIEPPMWSTLPPPFTSNVALHADTHSDSAFSGTAHIYRVLADKPNWYDGQSNAVTVTIP